MSLIRKKHELNLPHYIKAMIYGQVGSGKTTLALSAPKPVLLDFDGGVHRINFDHIGDNVYQVKNWDEALSVIQGDLSEYETIVVDTIGKMMDYIIELADQKRIGGWKKWEFINDEFKKFVRLAHSSNKHVILVAQRDTRSDGDETIFIPALREKNYTAVTSDLDIIGYVEMKGTSRTIYFNHNKNDVKNTCNLPESIALPVVVNSKREGLENTFFTKKIIDPFKAEIQRRIDYQNSYNVIIETIKGDISFIETEIEANDFVKKMKEYRHVGSSLEVARNLFSAKVKELGFIFNKAEKRYEKPAA